MEDSAMAIASPQTVAKIVGDPLDEFPEATYRFVARELKNKIQEKTQISLDNQIKRLEDHKAKLVSKGGSTEEHAKLSDVSRLLTDPISPFVLESLVSFVVASALEFIPVGEDFRRQIAYNLRVLVYEDIEHRLFKMFRLTDGATGFKSLMEEFQRLRMELQEDVKSAQEIFQANRTLVDEWKAVREGAPAAAPMGSTS
jgi:hypothetical protein